MYCQYSKAVVVVFVVVAAVKVSNTTPDKWTTQNFNCLTFENDRFDLLLYNFKLQ